MNPSMTSPFESGGDAFPAQLNVEPNRSLPRTLGILNIVFGLLLLLSGLCCGISVVSFALAGGMANQPQFQAQMDQAWKQQRERNLARLKEQLDGAADPAEKQEIERQMQKLRETPLPKIDPFAVYGLKDPSVVMFWSIDAFCTIVINLLLIVAGIGLFAVSEWGRKMSIAVAVIKLLWLAALYGYAMLAVVPVMARDSAKAVHDMAASMPQDGADQLPPLAEMAQQIGTFGLVGLVVFAVLGAIYPALMLLLLTRPAVKAATQGGKPTVFRPNAT